MPDYVEKLKDGENKKNANFPYWVLAISIFLTFALTYNFYQNALNKDSIRFANEVGRVQTQIENKINLYVALLKGGRGFVESATDLNRENFSKYIESLEVERNYGGMQGIGYTKIISLNEQVDLTNRMLAEGYTEFRIFPEADKKYYQPVIYLEPQNEANKKAVGFDMSAETSRREALEQARDTATAVASARVKLVEEDEENAKTGFLIFLPIYKNGGASGNLEERRKNLSGYIYSSFRANDFLSEIQKNTTTYDIAIRIYDAENKKENLLAQTVLGDNQNSDNNMEGNYSSVKELEVAGKKWILEYGTLPTFAQQSSVGWTILIFLSGLIFSLLLFAITYWEVSARATLQKTAAELFELQGQKQILLEKEQKARLSAEQANKTKDEFIAIVSHELRTPLNAIAGWTNILKMENLSLNTKKLALEKIEKNLRSQTKLVEELLDYSQIISRTTNLEDSQINFSEMFENVFQEFAPIAEEKRIELIKDNRLNGQMILGDEKIKLVIHNLFSNAVKFTDAGGRISAVVSEDQGSVLMSIKDNGKGISWEFLPHIFERFRQADNSITRNFGGLGLGLAISNHIVKLHNGTIEANSDGKGKGSVFTVRVPIIRETKVLEPQRIVT